MMHHSDDNWLIIVIVMIHPYTGCEIFTLLLTCTLFFFNTFSSFSRNWLFWTCSRGAGHHNEDVLCPQNIKKSTPNQIQTGKKGLLGVTACVFSLGGFNCIVYIV